MAARSDAATPYGPASAPASSTGAIVSSNTGTSAAKTLAWSPWDPGQPLWLPIAAQARLYQQPLGCFA